MLPEYDQEDEGNNWIEYLYPRLMYSFKKIKKNHNEFTLFEPEKIVKGDSVFHNFFQRGYIFYATGKMIDIPSLSKYFGFYRGYSSQLEMRSLLFLSDYFNAMQLEKMRFHVEKNHFDRERVAMTNICQAIEFCLKALQVHAGYWETRKFSFKEGHNCNKLFKNLPEGLQSELKDQSKDFCRCYKENVRKVNTELEKLENEFLNNMNNRNHRLDWDGVGTRVESNPLSYILYANDPVLNDEGWFIEAIENLPDSKDYKYGPTTGITEDVPKVKPIHYGITLGRFFYEYLFPHFNGDISRFQHSDFIPIKKEDIIWEVLSDKGRY